jgi:hypothetical protein
LNQDTDGDGVQDGFEYWTFRTSPILADTDGDQISDPDEVIAGNRNPLIADLPSPRISVGNVNLQLDTRFTFTDEAGSEVTEEESSETTLSRSEDETFSTSNEDSTVQTLEASDEIQAGFVEGELQLLYTGSNTRGSEQGNTFTASEESGVSSEETYNSSLTTSTTRDVRESVTREILDAAIKVDVSIENTGSLPFTISSLELSALTQDPRNRRRVIPVASLVPENPDLGSINIGALGDSARGPFVFKTISVFPQQVEELLKSPRGLIVKLANFDITDEMDRNFSFISRDVLDRTAGISFDLGDGRVENYRVATASAHNPANGEPLGISMEYALNGIIGLYNRPTIRDGGNGVVDTIAAGDDIQEFPVDGTVEPGEVIISVGPNGVLDSAGSEQGDDSVVVADYATAPSPANGHQVLTRYRDVETVFTDDPTTPLLDETKRAWGLFSSKALPNVDLDSIVLRAGDQFNFTFVQDQDDDNVWAREEYLHGSSDLLADTDNDGLTDAEEIQEGWTVQVRTSREAVPVYPNPVAADSDRDKLMDILERSCGLDPRQRDTDLDGLTDYEEIYGVIVEDTGERTMTVRDPVTAKTITPVRQYSGIVILDGGNGINDTLTSGDDILVFAGLAGGAILLAGPNGIIDSVANSNPSSDADDFLATPHVIFGDCNLDVGIVGFATDPLDADSDGDTIPDGAELRLGIHPNNALDGQSLIDDDGDGVANQAEINGFDAIVNGVTVPVNSNENVTDTDGDGLSDLLETYLGSNPQERDTDGDGLLDNQEYAGPATCVTNVRGSQASPCTAFEAKLRENHGDYVRDCDQADVCIVDDSIYAGNPGTNLNEADSDYDGVSDLVEWQSPLSVLVDGSTTLLPAPASDPLRANSDTDGWNDGQERNRQSPTNPVLPDTDGDGIEDDDEPGRGQNPNQKDALVRVRYTNIVINGDCDADGLSADPGDFKWSLNINDASRSISQFVNGSAVIAGVLSSDLVLEAGDQVRINGNLREEDEDIAGTLFNDGLFQWDQTLQFPFAWMDGVPYETQPISYNVSGSQSLSCTPFNFWDVGVEIIVNP